MCINEAAALKTRRFRLGFWPELGTLRVGSSLEFGALFDWAILMGGVGSSLEVEASSFRLGVFAMWIRERFIDVSVARGGNRLPMRLRGEIGGWGP